MENMPCFSRLYLEREKELKPLGLDCALPFGHEGVHRAFYAHTEYVANYYWLTCRTRCCVKPLNHSGLHFNNVLEWN